MCLSRIILIPFVLIIGIASVWADTTDLALPETVFRHTVVDTKYRTIGKILRTNLAPVQDFLTDNEALAVQKSLRVIRITFTRLDHATDTKALRTYRTRIVTETRKIIRITVVARQRRIDSMNDSQKIGPIDIFASLGIILDRPISLRVHRFETLHLTGRQTDTADSTTLYLQAPSGQITVYRKASDRSGIFSQNVSFDEVGIYTLIVASGNGFSATNIAAEIVVRDAVTLSRIRGDTIASTGILTPPVFIREEFLDLATLNTAVFSGSEADSPFRILRFEQDGRVKEFSGHTHIIVPLDAFTDWNTKRPVTVSIWVAKSPSDPFDLVYRDRGYLGESYLVTMNEPVSLTENGDTLLLHTTLAHGVTIDRDIVVLDPTGAIETYPLDSLATDEATVRTDIPFTLSIPLDHTGTYLVEVNYTNGLAAVNTPIIYDAPSARVFSVLPNAIDRWKYITSNSIAQISLDSTTFVNSLRASESVATLVHSPVLDTIAQIKAQDMADHEYIGHTDSYGTHIDGIVERANIDLTGYIGENVAGGDATYGYLLAALSLSPGHRESMLDADFWYMGIGYVSRNGKQYYVQVFSHENPDD